MVFGLDRAPFTIDRRLSTVDQMSESRTAIIAGDGTFTYDQLDEASRRVAGALLGDNTDLNQTRVAFFVPPSFAYAALQRGIWRAGGVAVPLAISHPLAALD